MTSKQIIEKTNAHGARNYAPKEVVMVKASGCLAWDPEGKQYYDMLSAYSAHNFGHCHPEIIAVAKEQLDKITLTSRAFYSENLGDFYEAVCRVTGKEKVLPMNTGAEAVETALKTARRWGAMVKGVPNGQQEIIGCQGNFHGRTISIVSFSNDETARQGYGPYASGFKTVPYGDAAALDAAIGPNTVAFIMEPIQGEAGIIMPPEGYLKQVREVCTRHNILMIADEVQTGFARTGDNFACQHEGVSPDIYIMGKALGGGVMPVSAIAANADIMDIFTPGSHGSTFGGNPLGCAVATKSIEIMERDDLARQAKEKGEYFMAKLREIENPEIIEIRGRGLLVGVEFTVNAAPYVKKLIQNGILAKETHECTIRFAPPLIITYEQLDEACVAIKQALSR